MEKKHLKFDDQVKEAAGVVILSFTTRLCYLCHETEKKKIWGQNLQDLLITSSSSNHFCEDE